MRKYLPEFIKPIIRFLYYKNERRKVFSNFRVKKEQNRCIGILPHDCKKLIVFIVPGADWFTGKDNISGGIMSIASIYEESLKLKNFHDAELIMCTLPGEFLLLRHTMFPNNINVYRFSQISFYFTALENMLFHVPEYMVSSFTRHWQKKRHNFVDKKIHINILNQRIDIMPSPSKIFDLSRLVEKVTQTTAHEQYTTIENRKNFGIPLHKLSVFGSPEKYEQLPFNKKENNITFSPDPHPDKDHIVAILQGKLPNYQIQEVLNITYLKYLEWVAKTRFTITLGEGLDFYFIETVFSGGVAFAIYDEQFFTDDFKKVPGVYKDSNEMIEEIVKDMEQLSNPDLYAIWNQKQYNACSRLYKYHDYIDNLKKFYLGEYTYA